MAEHIAIISRSAPRGDERAMELTEMLVTVAAFGLPCRLFFIGDGVLQLVPDQQPQGRSPQELLAQLSDFGVSDIYADQHALTYYALDKQDLLLPVKALPPDQFSGHIAGARHCFGW